MTGYNRDDRVRIVWPRAASHGLTGAIVCPRSCGRVPGYTIRLDNPPEGWPAERFVPAHRIGPDDTEGRIADDDILAIVTAADGATAVALHDRAERSFDIDCSVHGAFYSFTYARNTTVAEIQRLHGSAANIADRHATTRHTPREATHGSQ